jgi:selenide,water dikinase
MAQASGVGLRFESAAIPFLKGAHRYAEAGTFPGGASDNQAFFGGQVSFAPGLGAADRMLLFDPQTSGGLLLCVPPEKMDHFQRLAAQLDQPFWIIGDVVAGQGLQVV